MAKFGFLSVLEEMDKHFTFDYAIDWNNVSLRKIMQWK